MNHSLGIIQSKKSMAEWLAPELSDIVKGVTAILMMRVRAGEFALIVTKEDTRQASADTGKAMTRNKALNNLEEPIKFPKRVRKIRKGKQEREVLGTDRSIVQAGLTATEVVSSLLFNSTFNSDIKSHMFQASFLN